MITTVLLSLLILVACAFLNRVRGGGFYGDKLPGRAILYVFPLIGLLAFSLHSYLISITIALGYLFWGVFSWGATMARLGGFTPPRELTGLEEFLSQFTPTVAAFIRMSFVLPMCFGIALFLANPWFAITALIFAVIAVAIYASFFRPLNNMDWMRAEIATGGLWGLLIVSILFF